tara:strand:+ start:162 stop:857 length:696 start_codon:yes stop_codon:yes gene_type:complete
VAKELTHRAEELKVLGWSQDEIFRYIELWEYRQRWGAINLEREDRQFLRKAENALPEISKTKNSVKKPIQEKSYYRWLSFYLEEMKKAEADFDLPEGSSGLWPIILEEELRALDYYKPVLGLPDTLKAKALKTLREEMITKSISLYESTLKLKEFDFEAPLKALNHDYSKNWKPLRDTTSTNNKDYPVISGQSVKSFRKEVRDKLLINIKSSFPSLADTDKPTPPDDWTPN